MIKDRKLTRGEATAWRRVFRASYHPPRMVSGIPGALYLDGVDALENALGDIRSMSAVMCDDLHDAYTQYHSMTEDERDTPKGGELEKVLSDYPPIIDGLDSLLEIFEDISTTWYPPRELYSMTP